VAVSITIRVPPVEPDDISSRLGRHCTEPISAGILSTAEHLHELLEARGLGFDGPAVGDGGLLHAMLLVHRPLGEVLSTVLELGLRRAGRGGHVPKTPDSCASRRHNCAGAVLPIFPWVRFDR